MFFQYKAQWYTYELIDPRDGAVFYIGKGKGKRIDHHEREAKRGVCSYKCNKINSIINSGNQIIKNKIAYFWDEKAAYESEIERIAFYGLENLTNLHPGGIQEERVYKLKPIVKAIIERKELTPQSAFEGIMKYPGHFALYLMHRAGAQITFNYANYPAPSFRETMTKFFWEKLGPMFLDKAIEDPRNHEPLINEFKRYNIDLVLNGG